MNSEKASEIGSGRPLQVYLTGFRGTGKSSVARIMAREIGCDALDLDDVIEHACGRSIKQIFAGGGEIAFRDAETECLRKVTDGLVWTPDGDFTEAGLSRPRIVALGGGAIVRAENREMIRASGPCIWLTASAETLARRVSQDHSSDERRPALTSLSLEKEMRSVLRQRDSMYRDAADMTIATEELSPHAVAESALKWLRARGIETAG